MMNRFRIRSSVPVIARLNDTGARVDQKFVFVVLVIVYLLAGLWALAGMACFFAIATGVMTGAMPMALDAHDRAIP